MAAVCDICGKKPSFGMNVSHSHRRTKRRWNPNIQRVRAVVDGAPKRLHVCTSCIRAGKVTKPPRRTHEPSRHQLTIARRSASVEPWRGAADVRCYPSRCCQPRRSSAPSPKSRSAGSDATVPTRAGSRSPSRPKVSTSASASAPPTAISNS